ncbi:MAG: transcription elongation factor GreA [Lachnospiraceae bacterium]|jgi:transcription elongation factor GreA|nr:transcription elongation factor GreA [Lachnospiraceae bacterium]MBO6298355.1 transcription elongation factor GreA [Lachnospiraceae bacterium]MBP3296189.1 transcription elongation factor GreA [Lachnospiraceae bacterium]MBR6156378.1 transcription elongation factor GreA [Lachnospiraceae bacterium]MCR5127322.1 transcription elongation factor GreA [Lachnospiraceae bacterium]
MAEKVQISKEGKLQFEEELHELISVRRKEVAQKIKVAREQGDLSENAEYDAARDEQRDIEARIEYLEELLKNAEVIEEVKTDKNKVHFGSKVKIKDVELGEEYSYTIKGAKESDALEGKISNTSPLGMALIGHKKGDTIEVEAPAGTIKYEILEIKN